MASLLVARVRLFNGAHRPSGVRGRLLPCDLSFSYRKLHRAGKNPRNMKPSTLSSLTSNLSALTLCLLVPGMGRRGVRQAPTCGGLPVACCVRSAWPGFSSWACPQGTEERPF